MGDSSVNDRHGAALKEIVFRSGATRYKAIIKVSSNYPGDIPKYDYEITEQWTLKPGMDVEYSKYHESQWDYLDGNLEEINDDGTAWVKIYDGPFAAKTKTACTRQ